VQGIQTTVEALFPVEHIEVAPDVSAGLAPQHHITCVLQLSCYGWSELITHSLEGSIPIFNAERLDKILYNQV